MSFEYSPYLYDIYDANDDYSFQLFEDFQCKNDLDRATSTSQLILLDAKPLYFDEEKTPGEDEFIYKDLTNITTNNIYLEHSNIASLDEEISSILQSDNSRLKNLIEKLFQGGEPNDQELQELNDIEKNIFMSIKEKKLCTDEERNNKGKRTEEKQKLFFKGVLKSFEIIFFENISKYNKKKLKKKERDQKEFYNHYFLETAKKLNIDISNFYHPNK